MKKKYIVLYFLLISVLTGSCTPPMKYRLMYRKQFAARKHSSAKGTRDAYVYRSRRKKYNSTSYRSYGDKRDAIVRTARKYLGVRYRYGGTTPRGFDCSGLVMYVFRKNGISLPRSARRQYYEGRRVRMRRLLPGDLVFFQTSRRVRISHVGIYVGNNTFIHAPRPGKRVKYARINRYWQKRFIGGVRYL